MKKLSKKQIAYALFGELLTYMKDFQSFNLDENRDLDEIVSIVNSIPHNRGFIRNGIVFEGSYDFLLMNEEFLNEMASLFEKRINKQCSLNDFLIFMKMQLEQQMNKPCMNNVRVLTTNSAD